MKSRIVEIIASLFLSWEWTVIPSIQLSTVKGRATLSSVKERDSELMLHHADVTDASCRSLGIGLNVSVLIRQLGTRRGVDVAL